MAIPTPIAARRRPSMTASREILPGRQVPELSSWMS